MCWPQSGFWLLAGQQLIKMGQGRFAQYRPVYKSSTSIQKTNSNLKELDKNKKIIKYKK